jgi:protoporphyrinogen oxidase
MKIAVIGAGVAGITTAYSLTKSNCQVDVFESSGRVGGMAATITLWDQKVDIGPHRFFSNDKQVNDLWLEVAGEHYQMVNRLTRIYYNNKFFNYPLNIGNTLSNLGILEASRCVLSYLKEQFITSKEDESFEAWVQSKFGKRLYSIFFKTYSEKLWGIPCTELDSDFAAQRIKKLSLYEAIKNAALKGRSNKHKTLVDQFAYPLGGTGMVYERMARFVKQSGNHVHLNTPVYRVVNYNGRVIGIELQDGTFKEYDYVVSTMPYTTMVQTLTEVPDKIKQLAQKLTFRNTVIVYLLIESDNIFPDNWIYIHSTELLMGRVTNFRNWVPHLYNNKKETILAIEYWCNQDSEQWNYKDQDFIKLASTEITKTGLVKPGLIKDGHVYRINKCYPVYSKGYKEILNPINNYVSSIENLSVIGRYGSFKYNNQDHSILMGLKAAENIVAKTKHNLFDINTDYETYQESYVITETGLQKQ